MEMKGLGEAHNALIRKIQLRNSQELSKCEQSFEKGSENYNLAKSRIELKRESHLVWLEKARIAYEKNNDLTTY